MGGKGKKKNIVYLIIAFVIILIMLCLPFVVSAQSLQGGASLDVQQVQSFNHVQFHVEWITDQPVETAIWHFQFGDGTETVLLGTSGSADFSHDYAYNVGGVIIYHPSFSLPSNVGGSGFWTDPWSGTIVIDDRPIGVTYTVYLPIISKPAQNPYCSIVVSEQALNHVVFDVSWQNAGSGIHQIKFGDGAITEQFSGSNGSGTTWHDYPYPGGNFLIEMNLEGGVCSTSVEIDWP